MPGFRERNSMSKAASRSRRSSSAALIPLERVERCILLLRSEKVLLDEDLARLYGVTTGNLNKAVQRNLNRFPRDFMFRLTPEEFAQLRAAELPENLIFQSGTSSWGGRRKLPYAFTEQGVAMLSSVLRSARAVQVNIAIMRAFVRLRRILATHKDLARKIAELEQQFARRSTEHEAHIRRIYDLLDELINPLTPPKKSRIGFRDTAEE